MDAPSDEIAGVDTELDDDDTTTPDLHDELSDLLAAPTPLDVAGISCLVRRVRTLEFLAAVRIVVDGAGPAIYPLLSDLPKIRTTEGMAQAITALMLSGATHAPVAMIDFLATMVTVDPKAYPAKPDRKAAGERLRLVMANPPVDVMPSVIDHIVWQEADTLFDLLGKVGAAASRTLQNVGRIGAARSTTPRR